ncbi:hypothetical protein FXW25_04760 [Candidatus Liberibacter asiaticus]|nr:hypothetical protein FXW25_04760 [Candidatus Liberibacter asiaticus]
MQIDIAKFSEDLSIIPVLRSDKLVSAEGIKPFKNKFSVGISY